ncbi:MAG: hypothetical protein H0V91_11230 [Flavisolibacter sp.]|nr:hypothetical protein [Flavisolibacter sp.]
MKKLFKTEIVVLSIIFLAFVTGFILLKINVPFFETFTVEDGLIEWLTVIGLLAGSFTCFSRFIKLRKEKKWMFLTATFFLGIILFFAAGEEISWAQRLLGLQSPEYFQKHNTQGETNFHNLVLGGVRINRWIFSFLLIFVMSIYIIVVPLLYKRKKWMQNFVRYFGIPLPKTYQIISFILMFLASEMMNHEKRAELVEFGTAFLLFLVVAYPLNKEDFVLKEDKTEFVNP